MRQADDPKDNVVVLATQNASKNLLVIEPLSEHEEKLIRRIRKEANSANDTFTKYVFQTLSISGIALGAILEFMFFLPFVSTAAQPVQMSPEQIQFHQLQPIVGLAALPILAFALAICRIGTYYYTDTNRLFGFELFLSRVRLAPSTSRGRWQDMFRNIEWEEAMRAWRVVQSTLVRRIHPRENIFLRHRYSKDIRPDQKTNPKWFCQSSLFGVDSAAEWKAGKYLDTMQLLLLSAAFIGVVILWIVPLMTMYGGHQLISYVINPDEWNQHNVEYSVLTILTVCLLVSAAIFFDYRRERTFGRIGGALATLFFVGAIFYEVRTNQPNTLNFAVLINLQQWHTNFTGSFLGVAAVCIASFSTLALWLSARNERARRQILKDGVWSLHSCAIIWEAVVVAHFSAVERSRNCGLSSWELARMTKRPLLKMLSPVSASMWEDWETGQIGFEQIAEKLRKTPEDSSVDGAGLSGYTFWLGQEAVSLARWADDVPGWIGLGEKELIRRHGPRKIIRRRSWFR